MSIDNLDRKIVTQYYELYTALLKQRLMNQINLSLIFDGIPLHIIVPYISELIRKLPVLLEEKENRRQKFVKVLIESDNENPLLKYQEEFFSSVYFNRELFIDLMLGVRDEGEIKRLDLFNDKVFAKDFLDKNPEIKELDKDKLLDINYLFNLFNNAFKTETMLKIFSQKFAAKRFFLSQEIVMQFAFFDAYLSDSFEIICLKTPDKIEETIKIKLQDLFKGNSQQMKEKTIKIANTKFSFRGIKSKINILKKMKFIKNLSDNELGLLEKARITRNLIVHNGSRINEEYRNYVKNKSLLLDEMVPLDNDFIEDIYKIIIKVSLMVLENIILECFGHKVKKEFKIN